uniref:Uncharacterized protein n=1 Tax=Anguilla anguilla TaxID=7936 RepID=A0A0E9RG50_ANGAN
MQCNNKKQQCSTHLTEGRHYRMVFLSIFFKLGGVF